MAKTEKEKLQDIVDVLHSLSFTDSVKKTRQEQLYKQVYAAQAANHTGFADQPISSADAIERRMFDWLC